jgi:signal transduction histidine kinase/PAS domain-containing protein
MYGRARSASLASLATGTSDARFPKCVPDGTDASRTIADIVRTHEETRSVFVRHGLVLDKIGSKTLAEVSDEYGLDVAAMEREVRDAIGESAPFDRGGFEWDARANVARISSSLAGMLELTELSGHPNMFLARVHPEDRDRVQAQFRAARERHSAFTFEYRVLRTDGETRIYAADVEPIDDTPRFIGMIWDITTQHMCVVDAGPLLRNTLEATADGILVVDRAGNVTSYNQRFLSLWKIPPALAIGATDEALLGYVLDQIEEPEKFLATVHELYSSPERESFDVLRFKDGRVFERYSRPQRVAFAIVGRVWSFRDVTERERLISAKTTLVDAWRLLASLDPRSALDAVVKVVVPCVGDACAIEVFGDPEVVVSHSLDPTRPFTPVWPPEVRGGRSVMYDVGDVSQLAVPVKIKDVVVGAVGAVAWGARRHTRADLDVAERLAAEVSIAIENARLRESADVALRSREEFLSIAAHELRGPLSALNLAVQTLRRRDVPEPTRDRMLSLVEREGRRLTRFADDITDIMRARAGTLPFRDGRVDLVDVVRDSVGHMHVDIERSGSMVSVDAPQAVIGRWDRARLEQVVTNLVVNALKFGLGRPIDVAVGAKDGWAMLTVSDHGLGVPETHRETIFRPFERAVSVRHYGGLGLGLFIVRTIVIQYGGTVHVEARDHGGSRFVVRLPVEAHS